MKVIITGTTGYVGGYFFWAMYPFFKLVGMLNRMSEVADAKECRDISKLVK